MNVVIEKITLEGMSEVVYCRSRTAWQSLMSTQTKEHPEIDELLPEIGGDSREAIQRKREREVARDILDLAEMVRPDVFSDEACSHPLFDTAMAGAEAYTFGHLKQMALGIAAACARGRDALSFRGNGGEAAGAAPRPHGTAVGDHA